MSSTLDDATRMLIGERLLELVVHLLASSPQSSEAVAQGSVRAVRRAEILNYIEANFADATLNLNTAVDPIGYSRTYIQTLLGEQGLSFSERLRECRLDHAWRRLLDPRHERDSIAAIAHACGFSELSTFNRLFRARFGDTPRALRRRRSEV